VEYERVRSTYQTAYNLARPRWEELRRRAETGAASDYKRLHDRVDALGREAVARLSADERLQLTEDRSKFDKFVFEEGIKALSPEDRQTIEDVEAFRTGKDFRRFVDRDAWNVLSDEDRATLGSPAALSSRLTPEKVAFLEKIGIPLLTAEQRKEIEGAPSAELPDPRAFMLKHGIPLTKVFLERASIEVRIQPANCNFPEEDTSGSLLRGRLARCTYQMSVRGTSHSMEAALEWDAGGWRLDALQPDLYQIPEAYLPRRPRTEVPPQALPATAEEPAGPDHMEFPAPRFASWTPRQANTLLVPLQSLVGTFQGRLIGIVVGGVCLTLIGLVMTLNYRQLKNLQFVPEWLEGETQLEELELPMWWMRTITRLSNRRILQVRLNWFFTKRKVHAVALDDVLSVVWHRTTNWLLLAIGLWLVGKANPIALLVILLGLESKILSIRFNTPFAQMLWTKVVVVSFYRRHHDALARFYRKAQLHWTQVRTQKQLPVPRTTPLQPDPDRDFRWGPSVWTFVGLWMLLGLVQRLCRFHITFDDYVIAPALLGLPVAAALRNRRDALYSAVVGLTGLLTVKFPQLISFYGISLDADGRSPDFGQYFGAICLVVIVASVAAGLARITPALGLAAPLLWIGFVAVFNPVQTSDTSFYAKCALAVAAAVLLSWLDEVIARRSPAVVPTHTT